MFKIKVLRREDIENVLNVSHVIEAVEEAYQSKARNEADVFPMIFHEFESGKADMDIKAGHLKGANLYGFKQVSWFGENPEKGLPALLGSMMIFEGNTGRPLGLMDASYITSIRTGAAGAVGIKHLARKDSKNLLMIGTGNQAIFQLAASLSVVKEITTVSIYNPRSPEKAEKFAGTIKDTLNKEFLSKFDATTEEYEKIRNQYDVDFKAVSDIEKATKEADIIITATPSKEAMIQKPWIKPGAHISCIGSDMEGKQEIDEKIFAMARVFVDDLEQSIRVGETETAIKKEVIHKGDIIGEIGNLIEGKIQGRLADNDVTIFDTSGLAIQDLITAKLALELAEKKGLGGEAEI